MNILQITSSFFPVLGGQEKVVYEISKEMVKQGHKVTILTTDMYCSDKNLPNEEIIEGIEIKRFKNDLFVGGLGYSYSAIKWLKKNWKNYDIVHSHGYNRFLSEYAIKYLKNKKPTVFTPHGFIHTKKNYFFKKIHDKIIGKWIRNAEICTSLTKLDLIDYNRLKVNEKKVIEVPNGVNIKKFSKINKKEILDIKKKYSLFKKTILYVGRIHKSKGIQYILEAIKNLDIQFIIAGKDYGYKKELENKIEELKIKDKIIFIGELKEKDLINLYHSCDIFVLVSEWEGFGIVVIEAMASGIPVIVSDRGALPYLIKNKKNGIITKFGNTKDLKENIDFLLKNKKKSREIAQNGRRFSEDYSWEKITNQIIKIYQKIK